MYSANTHIYLFPSVRKTPVLIPVISKGEQKKSFRFSQQSKGLNIKLKS